MSINPKKVDPADIVKIVMVDAPDTFEDNNGLYEVRYGNKPDVSEFFDIVKLEKMLSGIENIIADQILDTLQNFRRVYINKKTSEITI